jgi:hypothetical protein
VFKDTIRLFRLICIKYYKRGYNYYKKLLYKINDYLKDREMKEAEENLKREIESLNRYRGPGEASNEMADVP